MITSRIPSFRSVSLVAAIVMMPVVATAQGVFRHVIPIKMPTGAKGMQPDLALVYTPGAGNGIAGMGWQLTGLTYITRVNYGSGINYAGQDTYVHSLVGVLVRQSDGSYRTKKDSFTKFVPTGTCGDGPCSWTAYDRSGRKEQYGTTSDSVRLWGASRETWGLASATDLFGNYYRVSYKYDGSGNFYHLYPNTVDYTYGPLVTGLRQVKFDYESRTDGEWGYPRRTYEALPLRLKWITVTSQSQLVRKYRLDYECGDGSPATCPGTTTGRSRLKRVTEYGGDGVSTLPSQTFTWLQGGNGFWTGSGYFDVPQYGDSTVKALQTGDFNGDGRADFLKVYSDGSAYVLFSNGDGTFWRGPKYFDVPDGSAANIALGDFDGDGRTDFLKVYSNGYGNVMRSNGDGTFAMGPSYFDIPQYSEQYGGSTTGAIKVGDFDGDKKADFLKVYSDGSAYVLFSNGDGTFWRGPRYFDIPNGSTSNIALGDFNGDGKTDFVKAYDNGYGYVLLSKGDGTFTEGPWYYDIPQYGSSTAGAIKVGDFNGDGKTDFLKAYDNGYGYVSFSKGDGTFQEGPAYFDIPQYSAQYASTTGAVQVGDFNGDGKTDFLKVYSDGNGYVVLSNGDGTFTSGASYFDVPYGSTESMAPGDFDGDGKCDFLKAYTNGWAYVALSNGPGPDLLARVDNGLGGAVEVEYVAATQMAGAVNPSSTGPGIADAAPQQVVTRMTTLDGRGGSFATTFAYSDARRYPGTIPNQRNLGFESVTARDARTGQYTVTHYYQSPGYEGCVSLVEERTGAGQLVSQKLRNYALNVPQGTTGVELVLETQETRRAYELGALAFSQYTTTSYDGYGNPTIKTHYADGLPTVKVTTTYANDTANWILGRTTRVTTTSGSTTLGDTLYAWTGSMLTGRSDWLDTTGSWLTTRTNYDSNGNAVSVTQPATGDGLDRTTTTEFDGTFRAYPTRVTNALGHVTQQTYDRAGLVTSQTDANGLVTTTTYDVFGRKRTESRSDGAYLEYGYLSYGDANAQHNTVVTKVDATRSAWKHDYFDGAGFTYATTSSGDCAQWIVVEHGKDAAGRPYSESQPHCYGASTSYTTSTYDAAGRPRSVTTPDGKTTSYSYFTNRIETTDANGQVTKKYVDARVQTTSIVDPTGLTTRYGYDSSGRLISVTKPSGATTTTTWDSLSRKTSVSDPQLGTTTYAYDAAGNMTSIASAGKTVTFAYDALNRMTVKQPTGEATVVYTYDESDVTNGVGRLTTVVDGTGTTRFSYAPSGQASGTVKQIDGRTFSHHSTWDLGQRLTRLTYPDGSYADYSYTDGGNLSTLSMNGALMATWGGYDARGKPGSVTYGNGVGTTYSFDGMGHMTSLRTTRGATALQDVTYDWYSRPNTGGMTIGSITDNRANKIVDGANTDESQTYSYDGLYRLTQAVGVWGTKSYAYDADGSLTTFGGLTNRTLTNVGQQVISGTGLSVTYDSAGNTIHKVLDGLTWDYTWTTEGRLATVSRNGALTDQMAYDANGQRVKKVYSPAKGSNVTTTYIGELYEVRNDGRDSQERHTLHLFGNGQLVASVTKIGRITTAWNETNGSRIEWALGSMYDARDIGGAWRKVVHCARALGAHPATARWLGIGLFAGAAAWLLASYLLALRTGRYSRRVSPGLRFASLAVVLAFGSTACGERAGGTRSGQNALVSGDSTHGPPEGTQYYHRNQINSTTIVTDVSGNETTRLVYLPFGEISPGSSTGSGAVVSKFTGKELDDESGLYYYGARYYDPAVGRFISPDPLVSDVRDPRALNRYAYCANNPIVFVDPTGHFWEFITDAFNAVGDFFTWMGVGIARAADWVWEELKFAYDWLTTREELKWTAMAIGALFLGCLIPGYWPVAWVSFGVAMAMIVSGEAEDVQFCGGALVIDHVTDHKGAGHGWGITVGNVVIVQDMDPDTVQHEYGHVLQSFMLGSIYYLAIGLPSFTSAGVDDGPGGHNHDTFYTEVWANRLSKPRDRSEFPREFGGWEKYPFEFGFAVFRALGNLPVGLSASFSV